MVDTVSKKRRSEIMSRIRSKDTGPEKLVRSLLHKMGFRYRLHSSRLPGKPDITLSKYNAVIFVHGCFWHGHGCKFSKKLPSTRPGFWRDKILKNRARDRKALKALQKDGWRVCCIWECALKRKGRIPDDVLGKKLATWLVSGRKFFDIYRKQNDKIKKSL